MKTELINPFIESVNDVFATMLESTVAQGKIDLASEYEGENQILAIIGISGECKGTVLLSFPEPTALGIVGKIMEEEFETVDATVSDGLGEVINMVAGGAKARLNTSGDTPMDLGLPSVIRGADFEVAHPSKSTWLEVPFESSLGIFSMRVTFEAE